MVSVGFQDCEGGCYGSLERRQEVSSQEGLDQGEDEDVLELGVEYTTEGKSY